VPCAAGWTGIANKAQPAMNTMQIANLECMGVSFDAKFICDSDRGHHLGSSAKLAKPTTGWIISPAPGNVYGESLKLSELI